MFQPPVPVGQFASRCWLNHLELRPHTLNLLLQQSFRRLFLSDDGQTESDYFARCRLLDRQFGQLYLALPEEMAARAFEHILQRQSVKNSFLVSGCLKGPAAKAGLYPATTLSEQLQRCWLDYFALLGQALQHKNSAGLR